MVKICTAPGNMALLFGIVVLIIVYLIPLAQVDETRRFDFARASYAWTEDSAEPFTTATIDTAEFMREYDASMALISDGDLDCVSDDYDRLSQCRIFQDAAVAAGYDIRLSSNLPSSNYLNVVNSLLTVPDLSERLQMNAGMPAARHYTKVARDVIKNNRRVIMKCYPALFKGSAVHDFVVVDEALSAQGVSIYDIHAATNAQIVAAFNHLIGIPNLEQLLDAGQSLSCAAAEVANPSEIVKNKRRLKVIYPLTLRNSAVYARGEEIDGVVKDITARRIRSFNVGFDMKLDSYVDYDNLFQTAQANAGVRMEVTPHHQLGLVISDGSQCGYVGLVSYPNIQIGRWYSVRVLIDEGKNIDVYVNGKKTLARHDPFISYKISDIVIGTGYSSIRHFHGEIRDFHMSIDYYDNPDIGLFSPGDIDPEVFLREYELKWTIVNDALRESEIVINDSSTVTRERLSQAFNRLISLPNLRTLLVLNQGMYAARSGCAGVPVIEANKKALGRLFKQTLDRSRTSYTRVLSRSYTASDISVDAFLREFTLEYPALNDALICHGVSMNNLASITPERLCTAFNILIGIKGLPQVFGRSIDHGMKENACFSDRAENKRFLENKFRGTLRGSHADNRTYQKNNIVKTAISVLFALVLLNAFMPFLAWRLRHYL